MENSKALCCSGHTVIHTKRQYTGLKKLRPPLFHWPVPIARLWPFPPNKLFYKCIRPHTRARIHTRCFILFFFLSRYELFVSPGSEGVNAREGKWELKNEILSSSLIVGLLFSDSIITCYEIVLIDKKTFWKDSNLLICEGWLYVGTIGKIKFSLLRRHNFLIAPWPSQGGSPCSKAWFPYFMISYRHT